MRWLTGFRFQLTIFLVIFDEKKVLKYCLLAFVLVIDTMKRFFCSQSSSKGTGNLKVNIAFNYFFTAKSRLSRSSLILITRKVMPDNLHTKKMFLPTTMHLLIFAPKFFSSTNFKRCVKCHVHFSVFCICHLNVKGKKLHLHIFRF